jgi:hypothetical protein
MGESEKTNEVENFAHFEIVAFFSENDTPRIFRPEESICYG